MTETEKIEIVVTIPSTLEVKMRKKHTGMLSDQIILSLIKKRLEKKENDSEVKQ